MVGFAAGRKNDGRRTMVVARLPGAYSGAWASNQA